MRVMSSGGCRLLKALPLAQHAPPGGQDIAIATACASIPVVALVNDGLVRFLQAQTEIIQDADRFRNECRWLR